MATNISNETPANIPESTEDDGTLNTKIWIGIGAFWFVIFLYCMTAWVLGPNFKPNNFGFDQAPSDYVAFLKGLELFMLALTLWILYYFVFRPLIRDRKFSFTGLYFLACFTLVVQEPWHSWIRPQLFYNNIFFNMGSWMGTLPVSNPNAYLTPLPLAFAGLGYFWIYGLPAYGGYKLMTKAKARNPGRSNLALVAYTFIGFCFFDFLIESFILRTGMFIYPSTIPQLTFFAGEVHQYPIYAALTWGGSYTAAACLLYFRNEQGESIPERNIGKIVSQGRRRTFLRWLALVGFLQVGLFMTYNVPYMFLSLHGGESTVSEETHPWFTAGMCGTSTDYACPGPDVAFPRTGQPTNRIEAATDAP